MKKQSKKKQSVIKPKLAWLNRSIINESRENSLLGRSSSGQSSGYNCKSSTATCAMDLHLNISLQPLMMPHGVVAIIMPRAWERLNFVMDIRNKIAVRFSGQRKKGN
jgi:hypothetical protein